MIKNQFYRKRPNASNDYQVAYDLIHSLKKGQIKEVEPDNLKTFRKYVCDLAMKNNIAITTRKINEVLKVVRIE